MKTESSFGNSSISTSVQHNASKEGLYVCAVLPFSSLLAHFIKSFILTIPYKHFLSKSPKTFLPISISVSVLMLIN
jgi:VIT1/CCC1 family predicted Fe2+/Mn2+ transporter